MDVLWRYSPETEKEATLEKWTTMTGIEMVSPGRKGLTSGGGERGGTRPPVHTHTHTHRKRERQPAAAVASHKGKGKLMMSPLFTINSGHFWM